MVRMDAPIYIMASISKAIFHNFHKFAAPKSNPRRNGHKIRNSSTLQKFRDRFRLPLRAGFSGVAMFNLPNVLTAQHLGDEFVDGIHPRQGIHHKQNGGGGNGSDGDLGLNAHHVAKINIQRGPDPAGIHHLERKLVSFAEAIRRSRVTPSMSCTMAMRRPGGAVGEGTLAHSGTADDGDDPFLIA